MAINSLQISSKAPTKRTRKSTHFLDRLAFKFEFRLATHLRSRTMSCVDCSSSNPYPGRRELFTVWPPNESRHKLIASQLYMREIYEFLRLPLICERLTNPFGDLLQVRTQLLASPFVQGLIIRDTIQQVREAKEITAFYTNNRFARSNPVSKNFLNTFVSDCSYW